MVRAAGLEPAQAFRPYGFSCHYGFRARRCAESPPYLVALRAVPMPFAADFLDTYAEST